MIPFTDIFLEDRLNSIHHNMNLLIPSPVDTATGRRRLTQTKKYPSKLDHSNIKITEKYIENESGDMVFTKLFEPKDPSKAKAMILHSVGYKDHISWTPHDIGVYFAQLGYIVFMFDHKGMGKTDGIFCQIDDFEKDIVDPAIWIFNYAINEYIKTNGIYKKSIDKTGNYFLSGHSMGGANTIRIALKEQQKNTLNIKGIILIAPMCEIVPEKIPSPIAQWILINILLPIIPNAKLIPSGLDKVTFDNEVQLILEDGPVHGGYAHEQNVALATAWSLLETIQFVEENRENLKIPMLVCQGDKDIVTDCDGCKEFFDKCGVKDKQIKVYKEKGHILWLEEPEMINDVNEWIKKYL